MKRIVILIIFFAITIHCASRIGFLSFLYSQRHEIAYGIGLITEIPIALCSSGYDFNDDLQIHEQAEEDGVPAPIVTANEIHLFFSRITYTLIAERPLLSNGHFTFAPNSHYPSPPVSIFHPPA